MRWLTLVLMVLPCLQAQPARLEGTVSSMSGTLLRKATVRLRPFQSTDPAGASGYSDTSDERGHFVFESVPAGRYSVVTEALGYLTQGYLSKPGTQAGATFAVSAGETRRDINVKMTAQSVISGKVTDEEGDPLMAQITVLRVSYTGGRRQMVQAGTASSDDQGHFRVARLQPGKYYLAAANRNNPAANREVPGRSGRRAVLVETYYPGALEPSQAIGITLAPGAEIRDMELKMRRTFVSSIRGKVVGSGTTPFRGSINLIPRDSAMLANGRPSVSPKPDGSFEFRAVTPGAYLLFVNSNQRGNGPEGRQANAGSMLVARVDVNVGEGDVEGVELALRPAGEITGTLKIEGAASSSLPSPSISTSVTGIVGASGRVAAVPAAQAGGRAAANGGPVITLSRADGVNDMPSNSRVSEDGSFKLTNVAPALYKVNVAPLADDTFVKSIRYGGVDVARTPLDVRSGAGGVMEVVLSRTAAVLSGVAQDSKGDAMPFATVSVWPKSAGASLPAAVLADQQGAFRLPRLAPGDYYVTAFDDLDVGTAAHPELLARFTRLASSVSLSESGRDSANVVVVPRDALDAALAGIQ